jgi:hypothetical protein
VLGAATIFSSASIGLAATTRSGAPTKIFVDQKQVHAFLVTQGVRHTYLTWTAFIGSVCGTRPGFTKSQFVGGAMERFQSLNTQNQLSICGATYRSKSAAHSAFVTALANVNSGFSSHTAMGSTIGNESGGSRGMSRSLHLPMSMLFFRHGSTLVRLMIVGHKAVGHQVKLLAKTINKNLGM